MDFRLIIDREKDENILLTMHENNSFAEEIKRMADEYSGRTGFTAYDKDGFTSVSAEDTECFIVENDRVFAVSKDGTKYHMHMRLYEIREKLPAYFIDINRSAVINRHLIKRFIALPSGAVDVEMKSGYRDCVSRRCFRKIKERFGIR